MSLRTRATSFLAGFALAGGATFYQLHKDINTGTEYLAAQVGSCSSAAKAKIAAAEYNIVQVQLAICSVIWAICEDNTGFAVGVSTSVSQWSFFACHVAYGLSNHIRKACSPACRVHGAFAAHRCSKFCLQFCFLFDSAMRHLWEHALLAAQGL
jgi:hypothetical protein